MLNSFTALVFATMLAIASCGGPPAAPVAPGPPIPVDAPADLGSFQVECDALVAALASYRACGNLEELQQDALDAWIEAAKLDFAAGEHANADPGQQHEIAAKCRRATRTVTDAHARCNAGKSPIQD